MKKTFDKVGKKAHMFIKTLRGSLNRNMSRGAEYVNRMISWARNENWRGQKSHKKPKAPRE